MNVNLILAGLPEIKQERFVNALAQLQTSLNAKEIYNPEFNDLKYWINNAFEEAYKPIYEEYLADYRAKRDNPSWVYQTDDELASDVYSSWLAMSGVKARLKKAAKMKPSPLLTKAVAFLKQAEFITDKMIELKQFVIKGRRKLAPDERKTPMRTEENTGTCAACKHNVKLSKAGAVVLHGYERPGRGYTVGSCVCVGYKPEETSPEGLDHVIQVYTDLRQRYMEDLEKHQKMTNKTITYQKKTGTDWKTGKPILQDVTLEPGTYEHKRILGAQIREIETQIEYITRDINVYTKQRQEWAPRSLPGDKPKL